MRSIISHVDGRSLAADIRMQRQLHKGSFALMEGGTDSKRFKKLLSDKDCCAIVCHGKANVIEAVKLLSEDGVPAVLGFIDQDFDLILGRSISHESIICSMNHDFDLDVLSTPALQRYLEEVAESGKLAANWDSRSVLREIIESVKPLSALRYANVRDRLPYKLSGLSIEQFFDGYTVQREKMLEAVFATYTASKTKMKELNDLIDRYTSLPIDVYQFTCGHDVCAALGIWLRSRIGSRKGPQTYRSEIELHLRLAVTKADFESIGLVSKIAAWEKINAPYKILA